MKSSTFKHKKGYVKLHTNFCIITIELHCDIVPRTCMNFLGLCRHGMYDNTIFHRLIPKFMIQGGSYADTNHRAEGSIWGQPFKDEFDPRLRHNAIGIVSMANAGPNTNQQQFFITFQSCPHLDQKHSVFGVVIDGLNIIQEWEHIPVQTKHNVPTTEIKILRTEVLVDPALEAYEYEQMRIERLIQLRESKKKNDISSTGIATTTATTKKIKTPLLLLEEASLVVPQVGRYLPPPKPASQQQTQKPPMEPTNSNVPFGKSSSSPSKTTSINNVVAVRTNNNNNVSKSSTKFGNFSGW